MMRTSITLGAMLAAVTVIGAFAGTRAPAAAATPASAVSTTATTSSLAVSTASMTAAATTPAAHTSAANAATSNAAKGRASDATPPMGWNSYNAYACDNGAQNMEAVARFIHDSGLEADGYTLVNSDGCYDDLESLGSPNTYGITAPTAQDPETCGAINGRLPDGELYLNSYDFPASTPCANDGFRLVGDDLHSLGLKLGVYLDAGNNWNCEEIPGSYGFDQTDAATLASWGADYVKIDWGCGDSLVPPASNAPAGYTGKDAAPGNQGFGGPTFSTNPAYVTDQEQTQITMYTALVRAIRAQKRPITVSIAGAGTVDSQSWGLALGDLDRPTGDANASFTATGKHAAGSVVGIVNADAQTYEALTGPGHWIDPDAMEVGNGSLTPTEDRSEMSMFSELAEPLLMSTNLCASDCGPDTTPATAAQLSLALSVFGNKRVIAVDQDALGSPATIVGDFDGTHLTMTRKLKNGDIAVTLFNESTTDAATMSATASQLGLPSASSYRVEDLWSGTTTTSTGTISATVAPTQTVMYRISPVVAAKGSQRSGEAASGATDTGSTPSDTGSTPAPTSTQAVAPTPATTPTATPIPTPAATPTASATAAAVNTVTSADITTRRTAGAGTGASIPSSLDSVSCATATRCAAVDDFGAAVVFDPAHPQRVMKLAVDSGHILAAVSCPSGGTACTAIDDRGMSVTFALSGRGTTARRTLDPGGQPTAIDCVSARQCTVVDGKGVEVTFDPGDGRMIGHGSSVDPYTYLASVSCATSSQCTAAGGGGNNGDTEVTFDPRTGAIGAAGVTSLDPDTVNGVSAVACPTSGACTVVDGAGNEVSFVPATGTVIGSGPVALEGDDLAAGLGVLTSVTCADAAQCTAVDLSGKAVTYDPATGTIAAPGVAAIDPDGSGLKGVACATPSRCVAVDLGGFAVAFDPTGAASAPARIDAPTRTTTRI
jgi:alpha-galactosidase